MILLAVHTGGLRPVRPSDKEDTRLLGETSEGDWWGAAGGLVGQGSAWWVDGGLRIRDGWLGGLLYTLQVRGVTGLLSGKILLAV